MSTNVNQHLLGIYSIIRSRVNLINKSIGHNGTQGTENEDAIKSLLLDFLPHNYGVGSGLIVGTDGNSSKQIDIIIYDKSKPNYSTAKDSKIFFADHVVAAIEIKTTYSNKSLKEALENIKSVRNLKLCTKEWSQWAHNSSNGNQELRGGLKSSSPLGIVFFFSSQQHKQSANLDAVYKNFKTNISTYDANERPDLVFSLGHSFVYKFNGLNRSQANDSYQLCLVPNNTDHSTVVNIEGVSKKNKYIVDLREERAFGEGMMNMSKVGCNFVVAGDSEEAQFYEIGRYKGKYYLLDKYRAFLNFIWLVEKMVSTKYMNPFWDIHDYLGTDISKSSNLEVGF